METWDGYIYALWDHCEDNWFCWTHGRRLGLTFYSKEKAEAFFARTLDGSPGAHLSLLEIDCRGFRPDVVVAEAQALLSAETKAAIARLRVYAQD